jgi:hypothetical protein
LATSPVAVYHDVTVFENDAGTAPSDKFLCIQHGPSLVIHFVVDCRSRNNSATNTFNMKYNRDVNMFEQPDGEETCIVDELTEKLQIPQARAEQLVEMGAVSLSPFPPRKGVMSGEGLGLVPAEQKSLVRRVQRYVDKVS